MLLSNSLRPETSLRSALEVLKNNKKTIRIQIGVAKIFLYHVRIVNAAGHVCRSTFAGIASLLLSRSLHPEACLRSALKKTGGWAFSYVMLFCIMS